MSHPIHLALVASVLFQLSGCTLSHYAISHMPTRSNIPWLTLWAGSAKLHLKLDKLQVAYNRLLCTQSGLHRLPILHLEAPRPQLLLLLSPLNPCLIHNLTNVTVEIR